MVTAELQQEKNEKKISYAEWLECMDCGQIFREGMFPVKEFFLTYDALHNLGARCIYCYNLKSSYPCPVEWFIDTADRLEHENEIKAFVDLYMEEIPHSYFTDNKYRLVVKVEYQIITQFAMFLLLELLEKDGMKCGELVSTYQNQHWQFTVDFADHERIFTR
jgi:hypothetical protein